MQPNAVRALAFTSVLVLGLGNSDDAAAAEGAGPSVEARLARKPLKAQRNLVEIGLFGGIFIPSDEHELYGYPDHAQQPFDHAPEVGLRLAYVPLPWLGFEAEASLLPTRTDAAGDAGNDDVLLFAGRGHVLLQLPLTYLAPFLVAGGGILGVSSDAVGDDVDGAFHWGGGFKYYPSEWVALRIDARHTMTSRVITAGGGSSHQAEVLAGLSLVLGWDDSPPPDRDGDGIIDARDRCPEQASSEPDGCPPPDRDGDGLRDEHDKCPEQPATTPDGCPPPSDRDRDGVIDEQDKCPDQPGPAAADGCPAPADRDADGVLDPDDKCPDEPETANGFEDADGCPDELPKEVKRFTGAIRGITFDLGRAAIRLSAFPTLDAAVNVLNDYPALKLQIRGHTDSSGSLALNMELSHARARAVKDYLVEKGIAPERLSVDGVGPNEPVADNKTKAGREQNRRIEFKLVN